MDQRTGRRPTLRPVFVRARGKVEMFFAILPSIKKNDAIHGIACVFLRRRKRAFATSSGTRQTSAGLPPSEIAMS